MKTILLYIISTLFLFSSCSSINVVGNGFFQKRKYTKGFYFSKSSDAPQASAINNSDKQTIYCRTTKKTGTSFIKKAENRNKISIQKETKKEKTKQKTSVQKETGDSVKVVLKDGTIYMGSLIEKTDKGVFILVENNRKVFLNNYDVQEILEISGKEKQATQNVNTPKTDNNKEYYQVKSTQRPQKKPMPSNSRVATILLIFGVFIPVLGIILIPLSLIFGIAGLVEAKKHPEKYDPNKAKTVFALALIFFVLLIFVVLSLFMIASML